VGVDEAEVERARRSKADGSEGAGREENVGPQLRRVRQALVEDKPRSN
jgi:hypothetical protein